MFSQTTYNIEVKVQPSFVDHESSPEDGVYVWAYEVEIANRGQNPIRICNRRWKIVNAHGEMIEVTGEGVIGRQPLIPPGETWSYISYTNLTSSSGIMYGSYECENNEGSLFQVDIPAFSLDSPYHMQLPN